MMHPQGIEAHRIHGLIWLFVAICAAIWLLVMLVLAVAIRVKRGRAYNIAAVTALYLNVFVLVAQIFLKAPFLNSLPPAQGQPAFGATQGVVLLAFVGLGVLAARSEGARGAAAPAAAVRVAGR